MFGLHYIKTGIMDKLTGRFFSDIYDMRQTGDYDDYVAFKEEDVLDLLEQANGLITKAEYLLNDKK